MDGPCSGFQSYPLFKKEKEKKMKIKILSTPCILLQCGQDETVTVILLVKADCRVSAGALHVGDRIVSIGNLPVTGLDETAVKHVFSHLQGSLVNLQVSVMSRADPSTQVGDVVTFLLLLLSLVLPLSLSVSLSLPVCLCPSVSVRLSLSLSPSLPFPLYSFFGFVLKMYFTLLQLFALFGILSVAMFVIRDRFVKKPTCA